MAPIDHPTYHQADMGGTVHLLTHEGAVPLTEEEVALLRGLETIRTRSAAARVEIDQIHNAAILRFREEAAKKNEQRHFIQVLFPGSSRRWTYYVASSVRVGTYVQVFSPRTNQHELVKVAGLGKGSLTNAHVQMKEALPVVSWEVASSDQRSRTSNCRGTITFLD